MRETFNSILTKIIIVMIIVFLMFGEYVVLKIYNSGTGLFGFMQSEATETVSSRIPISHITSPISLWMIPCVHPGQ